MFNQYDDLLSVEELCDILVIGKNKAYKILNSGKIKSFRIGRIWKIPKIAVEKYILENSNLQ
ncbi:MAG: helix-turn-helix domain-containing protein [Clostridium sp.]|jgi:excisionase family DNA binding protein|uniref:helix-turn-helix domain-containing protein n=1 Tax=Clostridium sp. TaxID=1506 RepID=UPI0025BAB604|nr:helix-turn-helix domain-containing protein [Clostridium sp.]MCH3965518.1 helix-turn-helix domain-containing protein [Clostridium sp.]MCI1716847.1 helix-turn-helix domain-containing protein [Clostridium sp.]MCI1801223.1 helix-turn-helix domain-containing protein [Clostridium sp.]MCI1815033.1 helix-turn-helix domain-containing protein [Clostridium sp.]MCI1871934.1 helix-turn-helix domain-containing protein [Clostridium sp.]